MERVDEQVGEGATPARPSGFWVIVSIVVAAVGIVPTWLVAIDTADDDESAYEREFEDTATQISNDLSRLIQRQADLVVDTGAMYASDPDLDSGRLAAWIDAIDAQSRHPELIAVAAMRQVPHDELDAFVDRLLADPVFELDPDTDVTITPSGERSTYCLLQAVVDLEWPVPPPGPGEDYCASAIGGLVAAARDTGVPSYLALPIPGGTQLVVHAPIYVDGLDPGDESGRRAAYIGTLATAIDPSTLFAQVLDGRPTAAITLSYDGATSSATFSSGDPVEDARTIVRPLGEGWTAEIALPGWETGVAASVRAVQILIAGTVASLAMALLVLVLGTSRQRARRLVAERTAELRHQTLHDSLTGLPNRTLVFDRAERLLARARRDGTTVAVLYFDLDGFKDVNDHLGHAAGDQLLRAVAERLTASLRGVDTIGRIGGDEFVVLVDGATTPEHAEAVADRLLAAVRDPVRLDDAAHPVTITASVGVALGERTSADELIRDADRALYRAKAAGRNRYVVVQPAATVVG